MILVVFDIKTMLDMLIKINKDKHVNSRPSRLYRTCWKKRIPIKVCVFKAVYFVLIHCWKSAEK